MLARSFLATLCLPLPSVNLFPCFYLLYLTSPYFSDTLLATFPEPERLQITHSRTLISNAIMSEIQFEDPKAQDSFETAVHHQIVAICQNLRINLILIDHLMHLYNDALASGKITPGIF